MTTRWDRIQEIFHSASALEGEALHAFLAEECSGDADLLAQVQSLLSAADDGDSEGHAAGEADTSDASPTTPRGHDGVPAASPQPVPPAPRDPMLGVTVERYTIKRVIGSGGMGVVYEAVQKSPRRTVALKMMKLGLTSKNALRRFEYEAQTLGRLRHEGIAHIHEAGTWDDGTGSRPWFAMEYLPGAKSITQYCDAKKFGTRERLAIFQKICAAVHHGHLKAIVHRDLKPGNILVTSSGVPKIIDFGVARSTDSDLAVTTLQTDVGALIGTLQYMSPEQCDADPNNIDIRSDVYALGVILYELLCGQLPYDIKRAAIHEAARIIKEEEPTKPSSIDKRLRGDIEIITLKALEKDRDRRYQSTLALDEDISRYLEGEPIAAKRPSAWDYMRRFGKRHRATAAAIVATFVVLVVAVVAIMIFAIEAEHRRNEVELRNEQLEQAYDKLEREQSEKRALTHGFGKMVAAPFIDRMTHFTFGSHQVGENPDMIKLIWETIAHRDVSDTTWSADMRMFLLYAVASEGINEGHGGFVKVAAAWDWLDELEGNYEITFPSYGDSTSPSTIGPDQDPLVLPEMGTAITLYGSMELGDVERFEYVYIRRFATLSFGLLLQYHPEDAMDFIRRFREIIESWPDKYLSEAMFQIKIIACNMATDIATIDEVKALTDDLAMDIAPKWMDPLFWTVAYERLGKPGRALAMLDEFLPGVVPEFPPEVLRELSSESLLTLAFLSGTQAAFLGIDVASSRRRLIEACSPRLQAEDPIERLWAANAAIATFFGNFPDSLQHDDAGVDRETALVALQAMETISSKNIILKEPPRTALEDIAAARARRAQSRGDGFGFDGMDLDASMPRMIGWLLLDSQIYIEQDGTSDSELGRTQLFRDPLVNIALNQSFEMAKAGQADWLDEADAHLLMSLGMIRSFQYEFGGHESYLQFYRDAVNSDPDPLVRSNAITALARHATPADASVIVSRGLRSTEPDPGVRWVAFAALQTMPKETLATWDSAEDVETIRQVTSDRREFIAIRHEAQAASSFLRQRNETPEEAVRDFKKHRYHHLALALQDIGKQTRMRLHDQSSTVDEGDALSLFNLTTDPQAHRLLGVFLSAWFQKGSWRDSMDQEEASGILSANIDRLIELELWEAADEPTRILHDYNLATFDSGHPHRAHSGQQWFRVRIELNWDDSGALKALTGLAVLQNGFQNVSHDALRAAKHAVELTNRGDPRCLYNLAVVHAARDEPTESIARFGEAVEVVWHEPETLNQIAWECVDAGDDRLFTIVSGGTLRAADRACELTNYQDPTILDTLARVHFERGELDEAIRWQQEALNYAGDDKRAAIAEVLATYKAARDEQPADDVKPKAPKDEPTP